MSKYKLVEISQDDASLINSKEGWDFVCENNSGTAYWNELNGELMWVPNIYSEDISYSQLEE